HAPARAPAAPWRSGYGPRARDRPVRRPGDAHILAATGASSALSSGTEDNAGAGLLNQNGRNGHEHMSGSGDPGYGSCTTASEDGRNRRHGGKRPRRLLAHRSARNAVTSSRHATRTEEPSMSRIPI